MISTLVLNSWKILKKKKQKQNRIKAIGYITLCAANRPLITQSRCEATPKIITSKAGDN